MIRTDAPRQCEDCGRPLASDNDWARLRDRECTSAACPLGDAVCWGTNCAPGRAALEARIRELEDEIAAQAERHEDLVAMWFDVATERASQLEESERREAASRRAIRELTDALEHASRERDATRSEAKALVSELAPATTAEPEASEPTAPRRSIGWAGVTLPCPDDMRGACDG